MKMPKNINQKLKNVPINNRVFCYDATIIIDFLNRTFMPLEFFVKKESLNEIGSGVSPRMEHMKEPQKFLDLFMSVGTMYDYYMMFRNQADYTAPVETRWRFGLIIKKLVYSKNGWQFNVRRSGRAQIWQAGPAMLRVKATEQERNDFKVAAPNVLAGQVEVDIDDVGAERVNEAVEKVHQEAVENYPADPTLT